MDEEKCIQYEMRGLANDALFLLICAQIGFSSKAPFCQTLLCELNALDIYTFIKGNEQSIIQYFQK